MWNKKFEFDEIGGGEYLKIRCYNADIFGDENFGSARVNLEGISEGSSRDFWVPLEKVNSGELRLKIEVVKNDVSEAFKACNYLIFSITFINKNNVVYYLILAYYKMEKQCACLILVFLDEMLGSSFDAFCF